MDKYLDKMIEKENLCASYVQKADELYRQNGKVHTKDEGIYIQRASDLRYEMAQISVGQERNVQQRRLLELNQRMKEIMKTTDPQLYKKITESVPDNDKSEETARYLKQGPAETKSKSPSPGTDQREIPQETVARWFKEAPLHSFDDVSGMDELKRRFRPQTQYRAHFFPPPQTAVSRFFPHHPHICLKYQSLPEKYIYSSLSSVHGQRPE